MTGAGGASLLFVAAHLPLTRSDAPTSPARGEVLNIPLLFPLKNSLLFNILFHLLGVKKTTVIFTHSKQDAENSQESAKNIANIKSYVIAK